MERIKDVLVAGRWQVWNSDGGLSLRFSESHFRRGDRLSVKCLAS